ncbi:MAG: sigma-54-dependent transcriptional regulator [Candidatus Eiseniibacteriota bacterium]
MMRILIVDDEARVGDLLRRELSDRGHTAEAVTGSKAALERLAGVPAAPSAAPPFDLVVTDLRMPPPDGMELLGEIKRRWPAVEVILMTAHGDESLAVRAMRAGASDYLKKDPRVDPDEVQIRIDRLLEARAAKSERERLLREVVALRTGALTVVGQSDALRVALSLAEKVAPTDSTVLIRGESGTGKDLFARAIHYGSPRASGPWVKVNCGALPENLLESELFGHERGAFTGAVAKKIGRFEQADGGTIFLDEIGEISPTLQVKLLQAIEEKAFVRVGGNETIRADVRIVAATNRDLESAVTEGAFREDLFYRLNIFPIALPALRERRGDLVPLVHFFLARAGAPPEKITSEGYAALEEYSFPGNVRELEHVIARALIIAGAQPVTADELIFQPVRRGGVAALAAAGPAGATGSAGTGERGAGFLEGGFAIPEIPEGGLSLEALEKALILAALEKAQGNKTRAARLLGLTRRTLYSRMEKHALRSPGDASDGEDSGGNGE